MIQPLSPRLFITKESLGWAAYLRGGKRIVEGQCVATVDGKPCYSSDALPEDEVHTVGYYPLRANLPAILCQIDLDKGERFVRYWTTVWLNGMPPKRLYALGWRRDVAGVRKHNILFYYPADQKIVVSTKRAACPPYFPDTFALLGKDTEVTKTKDSLRWVHDGETATLAQVPGGMIFRSS